ncbi:MAG: hypothetical protein KatS3mg110_3874 [Pirellulaceae bacterium]|nr:MAG: hypothetical protein KatS3mg110_3874 [Pirellulaceae bacterium]
MEFPEAKPFEEVRDELRLARFVLVANDSQPGTASWLVPERGMRLRLEGETEPLLVRGIDLYEPRAEDFVLRAWRNETLRIAEALADLEYALQQDPADKWALLGLARRWELVGYPEQAAARLAASGSPSQLVRFEQARLLAISGYDSQATALLDQASVSEDTAPLLKSLYALAKAEALARTPANAAQQAALAEYAAAVEWSQKALAGSRLLERYLLRDILLAAYTGAARVIAAGPFRNRAESVTRWLQPADQMLAHTQHAGDAWLTGRGRLWEARLGCFSALKDPAVEIPSEIQIQQWVDLLLAQGEDAFGERSAKTWGGRIWLRAAEAALANGDIERASRAAQQAALLLADTTQKQPPYPHGETWLGQTYYLLGAIEAIGRRNHAAALRWYDRALPLLEEPAVRIVGIRLVANQWVSIGISYWETGDQPAGLRYTQKGWQMLEAAIRDGKCPAEAARVACQNLAYMYKTLGDADNAQRMAELARTLASGSTPAPMPATPMR